MLTENLAGHLYDRLTGVAYLWECLFQTLTAFPLQRPMAQTGVYVFTVNASLCSRQCCFIVKPAHCKSAKEAMIGKGNVMKILQLDSTREFSPNVMKRFFLVEDSPNFKIINFNLDAGVVFPVHSHDLDGELSIQILEGEGFFLGADGVKLPAKTGDILVSEIREPHGVEATTRMRLLVTITPPI